MSFVKTFIWGTAAIGIIVMIQGACGAGFSQAFLVKESVKAVGTGLVVATVLWVVNKEPRK